MAFFIYNGAFSISYLNNNELDILVFLPEKVLNSHNFKHKENSDNGFKGTVVNQRCHFFDELNFRQAF